MTCQICEGSFETKNGLMVLHGYKRPGDGRTRGRCGGAGYPPYEVSCERLRTYKVSLEELNGRIRAILAEPVTYISTYSILGKLREFIAGVTELSVWESEVKRYVGRFHADIRGNSFEIERAERRIAKWVPPVA